MCDGVCICCLPMSTPCGVGTSAPGEFLVPGKSHTHSCTLTCTCTLRLAECVHTGAHVKHCEGKGRPSRGLHPSHALHLHALGPLFLFTTCTPRETRRETSRDINKENPCRHSLGRPCDLYTKTPTVWSALLKPLTNEPPGLAPPTGCHTSPGMYRLGCMWPW